MPSKHSHKKATEIALQLTTVAVEHSLIHHTTDAKASAENVIEYFNTIYDTLYVDDENETINI